MEGRDRPIALYAPATWRLVLRWVGTGWCLCEHGAIGSIDVRAQGPTGRRARARRRGIGELYVGNICHILIDVDCLEFRNDLYGSREVKTSGSFIARHNGRVLLAVGGRDV